MTDIPENQASKPSSYKIIHTEEDGILYVRVTNNQNEHLFCAMTAEKAEEFIRKDHAKWSAYVFNCAENIPPLNIEIIHPA